MAATAHKPDPAFDAWVDRAKAVSTLNAAFKFGFSPKGSAGRTTRPTGEIAGPCPRCGGVDRFSVNAKTGLWNCRGAGKGGADAISLARYLLIDASFLEAVTFLTGEAKPGRPATEPTAEEIAAQEAALAQRKADDAAAREKTERANNQFREDERRRCHALWRAGESAPGSLVEAYLRWRCIPGVPVGAKLRLHREIHLRHPAGKHGAIFWTGPAMLAPIAGNDGRFIGLHMTWLDPALADGGLPAEAKGKLVAVVDGERLDVKRSRGTKQGGHLVLVPAPSGRVTRIVIGEGIETVLSVWAAMLEAGEDLSTTEFWSSIDLGNLGGKATRSISHPTRKKADKAGRLFPIRVSGPEPDVSDPSRSIAIPHGVDQVLILADGDSDRFTVEMTVARASARWARPGLTVRVAWPEDGGDFNDMRIRIVRERGRICAQQERGQS
ncbi:DUF7146 domain-containing protein [Bosea massiliensis]|uniref:DUF7146 domain-containing protein n=1 Tax=Bosea massiliensis TaxID=151419 RepID=A0ABW0NYU8_9HYPH